MLDTDLSPKKFKNTNNSYDQEEKRNFYHQEYYIDKFRKR